MGPTLQAGLLSMSCLMQMALMIFRVKKGIQQTRNTPGRIYRETVRSIIFLVTENKEYSWQNKQRNSEINYRAGYREQGIHLGE